MNAIELIENHAKAIRNGVHDKIGPEFPVTMSNALLPGEGVAQGDLLIHCCRQCSEGVCRGKKARQI